MPAYYNDNDPHAAAWLRELVTQGLIAHGEIDDRSIADVTAADLRGFDQCHWFAGIGGWSYALRLAGWPDDRPVWSGSCPCQPFSPAGTRLGADDPRDLWPTWLQLIRQCRPTVIMGEQVASLDGLAWIDRVCADLEAAQYAIGAIDLCAASVGAPHRRQRLYWLGDSDHARSSRHVGHESDRDQSERHDPRTDRSPGAASQARGVADSDAHRWAEQPPTWLHDGQSGYNAARCRAPGPWDAAEWIACADGKRRPIESGSFPLADGIPARVVRLRGYGNAIVPQLAALAIRAYMEGVIAMESKACPYCGRIMSTDESTRGACRDCAPDERD